MKNGIIKLDSIEGNKLGFTSDKFSKASYLWHDNGEIIISSIITKGDKEHTGYFKELMLKLFETGLDIFIPTPSNRMCEIGRKQGWIMYNYDGCVGFGFKGNK